MNNNQKKLIALNAAVLALASLLTFALPAIVESLTDGRAKFLIAMSQIAPILCAIPISCGLIGKSLPNSNVDAESGLNG